MFGPGPLGPGPSIWARDHAHLDLRPIGSGPMWARVGLPRAVGGLEVVPASLALVDNLVRPRSNTRVNAEVHLCTLVARGRCTAMDTTAYTYACTHVRKTCIVDGWATRVGG